MIRREKSKQAIFLLISELLRSDRLPPVTLSVLAFNVVIYLELFDLNYPSLHNVCLSAVGILYHKQWLRLIMSPFFHADDWHLYYNMTSFGIKGRSLEKRYGSGYFAFLILVFTISCSLTLVGLEYFTFLITQKQEYLNTCAVGFSGKLLNLKSNQ